MAETREGRLVTTFVTLADTLVVGYDVVDLLHTLVEACGNLLPASAAGIMLADSTGQLALVASTSEKSRLVELMQLSSGNGPCVESFTTGAVYVLPDIEAVKDLWPEFYLEATEQGFHAVHAVPLRLRGDVLGTLNLFSTTPDRSPPTTPRSRRDSRMSRPSASCRNAQRARVKSPGNSCSSRSTAAS